MAFLTLQVTLTSRISTEDVMLLAEKRDFTPRLLVFPDADLRKKAQSTASWLNKTKLRPIGLNLRTKTMGDYADSLLVTMEEYNYG